MQAALVGLIGDTFTLAGGLLLALDAVAKEKDFEKIRKIAKTVKEPRLAQIRFVMEGVEISDGSQVEKAFIRRSARIAKWGCFILVIGFALLVVSRLAEIYH
jgi:hypothetical protein